MNRTSTIPSPVTPRPPAGPVRLLAGWEETGTAADWETHLAAHGPLPAHQTRLGRADLDLIAQVDRAGLLGRGGAGFPTARKLAEVAAGRKTAIVVANGCEGDLAGDKDHVLLGIAPHLVFDGIETAARAVGADRTALCLHQGDPLVPAVRAALEQRPGSPLLPSVVEVPARYVASVDSSLVNFLTTGEAIPTDREVRPSRRGVNGRPTLVDNVETLAHLALIARHGPEWFRSRGALDAPGTTLVTVGGAVWGPGVYEIELGAPLSHPLRLAGGTERPVQAVLLGGLAGNWLPLPAMAELPLTHQACRNAGTRLGIASLIALPASACGLAATARILHYLAAESAGQCGPCMFGLPAIAEDLTRITTGSATPTDLHRLHGRLGVIPGRGACAHPDGAAGMAASALDVFAHDLRAHLDGRPCAAASDPFPLPIPAAAPALLTATGRPR
jgi:NADH:ubiquinone oxidoreductase subunit F (NADH-binding)